MKSLYNGVVFLPRERGRESEMHLFKKSILKLQHWVCMIFES
jgi:hypothetical protein